MRPLIAALADVLSSQITRRFAFFGHSCGASIAFELTRYLQGQGVGQPERLFVSGSPAAHLPRTTRITGLPEDRFLTAVGCFGGMPEEVLTNPELRAMVLPALRADIELSETYVLGSARLLDVPISAYGGTEDAGVSVASLRAWRKVTRGDFHLRMFPGGHFFLMNHADSVIAHISTDLEGGAGLDTGQDDSSF